jgi:hypothetical protein
MTPKIKIEGPLSAGSSVYLMEGGKAFTTHKEKAAKAYPQPMGRLIVAPAAAGSGHQPGITIKLNAFAESALSSLE